MGQWVAMFIVLFLIAQVAADADDLVCSKVQIQLDSHQAFERQAFLATMTIQNGRPNETRVSPLLSYLFQDSTL
jgi:hypothetical protein